MTTVNFYRDLPALESFAEAVETDRHVLVPDDWWIVIADVTGSTQAIESGAYKKVNTVGAACIAAVVNVDRTVDIPFVFGGDGATFVVPDTLRERVIPALREAQRLSRHNFDLSLRVGMVRVSTLVSNGLAVRLAKIRLSPNVTQPTFSGAAWEEAERMVKDPLAEDVLRVEEHEGPCEGSFEGFECRWQGVPSFHDHKLALLVAAVSDDANVNLDTYRQLSDKIAKTYGHISSYHPLRAERMRLSFSPRELGHEWRVRSGRLSLTGRFKYFARMVLLNLAGVYLFARRMDTSTVRWSRYVEDMVENSDFRKFDGMLRMVMDGSDTQYEDLRSYLEAQRGAGRLVYGMHKSREALVTCIVFSYNGAHVHFVDGSDGGYAMAARGLKAQLKALARSATPVRNQSLSSVARPISAGK
ncbi:MAG TPA: DUF3095 domain-containing protein [Casimicrobiaceae bacterium]|nr:DUF3095 domain-containing protein [Casimicrobiaceae bacterium]